jgi:hypothetical protein
MVSEFVDSLGAVKGGKQDLPPVTASLLGLLKGQRLSEEDHKKHLREKYS